MDGENNKLAVKVKKLLADFLGVEVDDIKNEDSLSEELHMTPADLTDFVETLKTEKIDTTSLELTEIETFEDLIEKLIDHT